MNTDAAAPIRTAAGEFDYWANLRVVVYILQYAWGVDLDGSGDLLGRIEELVARSEGLGLPAHGSALGGVLRAARAHAALGTDPAAYRLETARPAAAFARDPNG